jgi:hypothetical protein
MAEQTTLPATELIDHAAVDRAHAAANKEALLEHARMGRSVSEWRDGKIVDVTPAEIFARYGLDENGRPKPEPKEAPPVQDEHIITDSDLIAQVRERERLDQLLSEGKLNQYFGQYLIAGAGQIFARGDDLVELRREAEPKATAAGISPEQLIAYYVAGPESFDLSERYR